MSAQKPVQSDDPIELLADSMNVWVGKLSDIVHKVIDTEPIRNVINWARMYSLWPVNITTACCSAEFGAASGARHDRRLSNTESSCFKKKSEAPRCILRVEPLTRERRQSHQETKGKLPRGHQRRNGSTSLTNKCHSRSREDRRRSDLHPRQNGL